MSDCRYPLFVSVVSPSPAYPLPPLTHSQLDRRKARERAPPRLVCDCVDIFKILIYYISVASYYSIYLYK